MKKRSASTIKLYSIDDESRKNTIEKIKAALIGLGLKYVPEDEEEKKTPPHKRGCIKSF